MKMYSESWCESASKDELLVATLNPTLSPGDLTNVAEYLGKLAGPSEGQVFRTLSRMLNHPSPLVREGAALGLANFQDIHVLEVFQVRLAKESSPGVRAALEELIEELQDLLGSGAEE